MICGNDLTHFIAENKIYLRCGHCECAIVMEGKDGTMKIKRIVTLLLCLCVFCSAFPVGAYAAAMEEIIEEITTEEFEPTNSLGEIGGYLAGNAITTANLFAERKFTWAGGTGFAAERGNNLIDTLSGVNSTIVGDNNVANGPDRMIVNRDGSVTWIQDKYFSTAKASVDAAFDVNTGMYRYMDGDGKPMQLEVPADQYNKAVELMRRKIEEGLVNGVTDPDEAVNIVRKGSLTYNQAANIAKAGTIESLKYDAVNGIITATCAVGINFVIDYACCVMNGIEPEIALKNAGLNGLKTGGVVFATYVISSQLSKTGITNALVPTAEAIARSLGDDVCEAIVMKAGIQAVGNSATRQVAQIISKELIADGVLLVVLTGIDVVELFRGRISKEELLKNLTVTVISVAAGTAGGYGGAVVGTMIAPGAGTAIGAAVGSLLAGGLSAWGAEAIIAPYYESDAEEMYNIIVEEFTELCSEYLITEEEGARIVEELKTLLVGDVLKEMYAAEDRRVFADELIEPLFEEEVSRRETIVLPTMDALRYQMKDTLQGIVFVH